MKKLFGNLKLTWPKVLLFAAFAGLYTGLVMLPAFLKDTSFQDIGISFEWWVIFAVIIVVNCKKPWEAMLKCFVFFLVSQPVVYLVEVVFGKLPMERAVYYYRSIWLPITLLTLPGGFIAFFCKKQNLPGSIILGLGNTLQVALGVSYTGKVITKFPYHLLSAIVCFASVLIMTFCIQKKKKYRWISILIPIVLAFVVILVAKMMGRVLF